MRLATLEAIAREVASDSTCTRRQVGAVIVSADNRLIATGRNGAPAGYPEHGKCNHWCPQTMLEGDGKTCFALHAELNALLFTSRWEREGGMIVTTSAPCLKCSAAIANSGLYRCHSLGRGGVEKDQRDGLDLMSKCGITVTRSVLNARR